MSVMPGRPAHALMMRQARRCRRWPVAPAEGVGPGVDAELLTARDSDARSRIIVVATPRRSNRLADGFHRHEQGMCLARHPAMTALTDLPTVATPSSGGAWRWGVIRQVVSGEHGLDAFRVAARAAAHAHPRRVTGAERLKPVACGLRFRYPRSSWCRTRRRGWYRHTRRPALPAGLQTVRLAARAEA